MTSPGLGRGFLIPRPRLAIGLRCERARARITAQGRRVSTAGIRAARSPLPLAGWTARIRPAQFARRRSHMSCFRDSQPHSQAFRTTYHCAVVRRGHRTPPSTRQVQKSVSIPVACRRSVNAYALAVRELFEFRGVKQARHNFFIFILLLPRSDLECDESPGSIVFSVTSPHDPHGESATGDLLA